MLEWDGGNVDHIADHRLTADEVEQAVQDPGRLGGQEEIREGELRGLVLGRTARGRILAVVFTTRHGRMRVVTAYPASARQQREFREHQRRQRGGGAS